MSKELDERVKNKVPKRGEIWLIKCDKIKEFSKDYRPGLVISNDIQNEYGEYVVVAMMTTDDLEDIQLFEVFIKNAPETGLDEPSKIVLNHPFTVFRKLRLEKRLGIASREVIEKVKLAWKIAFDVENW
jgi:mRNA-degrading endonuclease toxin of MazEF toxin-antitoxin module